MRTVQAELQHLRAALQLHALDPRHLRQLSAHILGQPAGVNDLNITPAPRNAAQPEAPREPRVGGVGDVVLDHVAAQPV